MTEALNIPQDFQEDETLTDMELAHDLKEFSDLKSTLSLMNELPNC